jgi:tetratricopeptide (TPR) repeat protein
MRMVFIDKIRHLLKTGNSNGSSPKKYLDLVQKDPHNANAHLKLAEIYQKKGEKKKALSEYLLAADIFTEKQSYDHAIAIYKQLYRQDPTLDQVYLKIADIYRERGFLADATAQYRILAQYYESSGMKDEASEIMKLISEMEPPMTASNNSLNTVLALPKKEEGDRKLEEGASSGFFDLGAELRIDKPVQLKPSQEVSTSERVYGAKEIFKELEEIGGPGRVDPHFNYTMGVAYRKLGYCDEAIEQFEIAVKERQKPFEALSMLGFCYKEKGMWDESQRSFESALGIAGTAQEKILNVKYILGLLYQEKGQTEDALKLLQEIATMDKGFQAGQDAPI